MSTNVNGRDAGAAFDVTTAAADAAARIGCHADHGERMGFLGDATVRALGETGMLSLWRPRAFGGHECDPVSYAIAAEQVAAADTAAAWIMHGTSASWLDLRSASDELVDEVVASAPAPVLADTYNRPMKANRVDGGYRVEGATPFASGCRVADWIAHTAVEGERLLLMFHPRGVLTIEDDWDSLGIRGSSSNTVVARDVFVPSHRVIDFSEPMVPGRRFDGPLYRMPTAVVPVAVAAVSLGALRASLDAASEIAANRTRFAAPSTLKHRALAQHHFGRALATYRAARALLHESLKAGFEHARAGREFDTRAKADLFLAYTFALQSCAEAVRELARAIGTAAIYKGNVIERALRDTEVASHHAFGAEGRYASVAQAYWDCPVDFPMLEMA